MSRICSGCALLEGFATSLAAVRISNEHIHQLTVLAEKMARSVEGRSRIDLDRISKLNSEFHKIILEAANSRKLQTLMAGLIETTIILRTYKRYTKTELTRSLGHNRELIAAFAARDPEWAQAVMTAHILAARATYLRTSTTEPRHDSDDEL